MEWPGGVATRAHGAQINRPVSATLEVVVDRRGGRPAALAPELLPGNDLGDDPWGDEGKT